MGLIREFQIKYSYEKQVTGHAAIGINIPHCSRPLQPLFIDTAPTTASYTSYASAFSSAGKEPGALPNILSLGQNGGTG